MLAISEFQKWKIEVLVILDKVASLRKSNGFKMNRPEMVEFAGIESLRESFRNGEKPHEMALKVLEK